METLEDQLLKYIREILEPKNKEFGNLPICPFVKKERLHGRITFKECSLGDNPTSKVLEVVNTFFAHSDGTLIIYDTDSNLSIVDFVEYGKKLCELLQNQRIISIALHPADNFNINGVKTRTVPFHVVLIQKAEEIIKAKNSLLKTKYYENWNEEQKKFNDEQIGKYL